MRHVSEVETRRGNLRANAWVAVTGLSVLMMAGFVAAQEIPDPPFRGTIFDFPDLMNDSDPSAFVELEFVEQAERQMFDRRVDRFQAYSVFVFKATYRDREPIEVAVNREFETQQAAEVQAKFYAEVFGRLPLFLRREIDALHLQAGNELFGGGRNILIHTEQGETYRRQGILEETLGHEAAHALDRKYARGSGWQEAQKQDRGFISTYAQENPTREDLAESVIPYLAIRFRPERIQENQREKILAAIEARIAFFDSLSPESFPSGEEESRSNSGDDR